MQGDGAIRGVIFDLGSTLIRFNGDWPEILQESSRVLTEHLEQVGFNLDGMTFSETLSNEIMESYQARETDWIERTTASLLSRVMARYGYAEVSDEVKERAMIAFYAVSEGRWEPMVGVYDVLDELLSRNLHLGLISNAGDEDNVHRLIDNAKLRSYFEPILISAAEGIRKPNPRLFETVLEAWDIPSHQAVMVGDNLGADILGAQHVGMHQIWLTAQANTTQNQMHEGVIIPEVVADNITEVPALIRHLSEATSES